MLFSDKLSKFGDNISISIVDNGFVVEGQGRLENGEWYTSKVIALSLDEVVDLLRDAISLPRES